MEQIKAKKEKRGILSWEPHEMAHGSLYLALFIWGFLILLAISVPSIFRKPRGPTPDFSGVIFLCLIFTFAIPGFVMGIIAMFEIVFSPYRNKGTISAIAGVLLNGYLVWMLIMLILFCFTECKYGYKKYCRINLSSLGKAIMLYSNDYNDQYPTSDKWCNLLIQYSEVSRKTFLCKEGLKKDDKRPRHYVIEPGDELNLPAGLEFLYEDEFGCHHYGKNMCHFAMNPDCKLYSPQDTVLLFEAKGGWNQHGGPEILTTEYHKGKGCYVFFNDGHTEFVRPEDIGKLKWKEEGK